MAQLAYSTDIEVPTHSVPRAHAGPMRSVTLFGEDERRLDRIASDARIAGLPVEAMRPLATVAQGAGGVLGDIVVVDVPQVTGSTLAALARLDERVARAGAQMIVLTSESALEDVFGCLERARPQIVVGGGQAEGLIALGAALAQIPGRRLREMDEEERIAFLKLTEQLGRLVERFDAFEPRPLGGLLGEEHGGFGVVQSPAPGFRGEADGQRRARPALPDPRLIHRIIAQRRLRAKFFPDGLFADPAWDMLLDLTAARVEHRRVSVTSLCIAAGVPSTTALRWIGQMIDSGMLVREQDDQDRRRAFVDLSEDGAAAMARYFKALGPDASALV